MIVRKKVHYILLLFLLYFGNKAWGQSFISGSIINNKGKELENIHVLFQTKKNGKIQAFAITDRKGHYSANIVTDSDSVLIKVQSLNYGLQQVWLPVKAQVYNFTLYPDSKEIKEVLVKAPDITQRGDTLTYSVGVFSNKKDRVIADVIHKMPGLEVQSDGKILYQGRPIQKYYIEGLDLLEGKYNLANNNLPAEDVASVQVMENHEPIKILEKLHSSDNVALNIKLKKSVVCTGTADIGAGVEPFLWNANLTPMLFSKNQQAIGSYQANNTGNDVEKDLKSLTIEDLLDLLDNNTTKEETLGIQHLSTPGFKTDRYLDNNVNLFSANYLVKLNNDIELKINNSYLNDYQKHNGSILSEYYLSGDTVSLQEMIDNKITKSYVTSDLILLRNTKKSYLKNKLHFNKHWDKYLGDVLSNQNQINQQYNSPFLNLSNQLKWYKTLKKTIFQFHSFIGYKDAPQSLYVKPGVFEDILNNNQKYEKVIQNANSENLNIHHSFSVINKLKKLDFIHKLGYQAINETFETDLYVSDNFSFKHKAYDFINKMNFKKNKIYCKEEIQFIRNRIKFFIEIPISFMDYDIEDDYLNLNTTKKEWLFQPQIRLNYKLNSKMNFKSNIKRIYSMDDGSRFYYSYVLNNYRSLQKNEVILGKSKGMKYGFLFNFKNPLKGMFINISANYIEKKNDIIRYNQIQENGSSLLKSLSLDNKSYSKKLDVRINKRFRDWNTNVSLGTSYSQFNQKIILNDLIQPIENTSLTFKSSIKSDPTTWLTLEGDFNVQLLKSKIAVSDNHIKQQSYKIQIMLYPWNQHYFGGDFEYYNNESSKDLFIDFKYRYTFKNKSKLELKWVNVLDNSSYYSYNIDEYSLVKNYYKLRSSSILLTYSFSF